ncbi:8963_t:CDS:2 [Gigaspora rosea]|nr:8963_t:CDS:2 [Gigaspora rosea]
MADFVCEGGEEQEKELNEPTEEYYKWIEKLNQKFERVVTCVELPKWGESTIGVEFSNSESDWDNNWPCTGEAWWDLERGNGHNNQSEVSMIGGEDQCEVFMIWEETSEEEEPEEPIPKAVLKKLNEYRSRAPSCKVFMGPLHEARNEMNRKLDMKAFEEELEKQKPELEFLLETETAEQEEGESQTQQRQTKMNTPI